MRSQRNGPVMAALVGALLALVLAYGLTYLATLSGVGNVTAPGESGAHGLKTAMQAALNLYAAQHVTLSTIQKDLLCDITLPITIWTAIPGLAALLGGYIAAKRQSGSGLWGMLPCALVAAVLYTFALAVCASLVKAHITPAVLPSAGGAELNPPDVPFSPSLHSVIVNVGLFSLVFSFVGGLFAFRSERSRLERGNWWICGKATILVAIVVQLLMVVALCVLAASSKSGSMAEIGCGRIVQLSPTAAGLGYSLIYGCTLDASARSPLESPDEGVTSRVNLYTGKKMPGKPDSTVMKNQFLYVVGSLALLAAFISGALAVKWGSRDGSIPTGFRIALIQALYLLILMHFCWFGWRFRQFSAEATVLVKLSAHITMFAAVGGVFVAALAGAFVTSRWYSARRGFPSA